MVNNLHNKQPHKQLSPAENDAQYDRCASQLTLDKTPVVVSQVSPARARALLEMGIHTLRDLITTYPRRYIDFTKVSCISKTEIGETYTILGEVYKVELKRPRPKLSLTVITLIDGTGTLIVTMFYAPWLARQLSAGARMAVSGKVEFGYGFKRMTNPMYEVIGEIGAGAKTGVSGVNENPTSPIGRILPIHPASGKISPKQMRRIIANALVLVASVPDPLPLHLRVKHRLMSRSCALRAIHFPHSLEERDVAKKRIAYEELLTLQLKLMYDSNIRSIGKTPVSHVVGGKCQTAFRQALPFNLTDDQSLAIAEVNEKLRSSTPANHLILGDVGTGKTVVAGVALCACADTKTQAILMAPTEVLAQQHTKALGALLDSAGVTWALLTGSTPKDERARIIEQAHTGILDVLIGTHALLEDDVAMPACSLVIIDEQQRFGVNQRHRLIAKGECVDALYLTATPIPRTLALATLGNMTLSYLTQKPHETKRATHALVYDARGQAYEAALNACKRGEQVYIVCPLIGTPLHTTNSSQHSSSKIKNTKKCKNSNSKQQNDCSDSIGADNSHIKNEDDEYVYASISIQSFGDYQEGEGSANITAATKHAKFLQDKIFGGFKVEVLHGRMKSDEKDDVMKRFRSGEISVLVSTTVIEVGVDVPNATVLIVEDADRFGLSQLHQLRGRVGRGDKDSQVFLISRTTNFDARARLEAMERTDDGFELASFDLKLRREGDILGNKQHGASSLKMVNIIRDSELIETAHADAQEIIKRDPQLKSPEYALIARECRLLDKNTFF